MSRKYGMNMHTTKHTKRETLAKAFCTLVCPACHKYLLKISLLCDTLKTTQNEPKRAKYKNNTRMSNASQAIPRHGLIPG